MNKPYIKKLPNGLTLAFIPRAGIKSVTIHLRGLAGSSFESKKQIGAAHLAEHLSVDNTLKEKLLFFGAKIIGVTSRDEALFMVKINNKDLKLALEYLLGVFTQMDISEADLQVKKNIVCEEVKRFENIPEKLIGRLSYRNLYKSQRMSKFNTGDIEDIMNLSLADIKEFKNTHYTAANFVLTISGDLSYPKVLKTVESVFGKLPKGEKVEFPEHATTSKMGILCAESPFFKQTHFKLDFYGYTVNNKKRHFANLLAKIFDDYLNDKVKSRLGLAYIINCDSFSSGRYGLFGIYFAASDERFRKAFEEILFFIKRVDAVVNTQSLERAKNRVMTDLEFDFEKTSFVSDYYSEMILFGNEKENFDSELETIKNTDISEILNIAKEIFSQQPKITVLSKQLTETEIRKLWNSHLQR